MTFSLHQYAFLFVVFSVMGWFLETSYRTLANRRFINPGVLAGPYVPLYGFSGIVILMIYGRIGSEPLIIRFFTYALVVSIIEYLVGELLLLVFKRRYWDYSNDIFNVQGHICLIFSMIWGVLSLICERVLYPLSVGLFTHVDGRVVYMTAFAGLLIMGIDLIRTTGVVTAVRAGAGRIASLGDEMRSYLGARIAPFMPSGDGNGVSIYYRRFLRTVDSRMRHAYRRATGEGKVPGSRMESSPLAGLGEIAERMIRYLKARRP